MIAINMNTLHDLDMLADCILVAIGEIAVVMRCIQSNCIVHPMDL